MATHWHPGSRGEEGVGDRRAPVPAPPPVGVVVEERMGLEGQISMLPWLSPALVPWVEEEGEEMVVAEGRCCRQLEGCCSWKARVGGHLPAVFWIGSGSAGEPACCTSRMRREEPADGPRSLQGAVREATAVTGRTPQMGRGCQ